MIGGVVMKENKLVELSMDFSVDIINLVKFLKSNHRHRDFQSLALPTELPRHIKLHYFNFYCLMQKH